MDGKLEEAGTAVPDFQSLMLPVLRAAADGEISAVDLRNRVASELHLTEAALAEMLPSGRQTTFSNRTAWANIFLQRAGLLEKVSRGVYRITDQGRKVLAEGPERINMRFLERYPAYVEWRQRSAGIRPTEPGQIAGPPAEHQTPEEQIEASQTALMAALQSDLLERVRELSPAFFEQLIIDLLIAMGYGGGRAAIGRSGDGGIDGMIKEDALGLDIVYVQGKRYGEGNTVGRSEVQSFAGSLDGVGATKGNFFATSTFSQGAHDYVGRINKRIVLIDAAELTRLMIQRNVGVRTSTTYEVKKVDEDYFTE
jgi:restriction system protein